MADNIWCLFSIENNYDQPDNNLCRFWFSRPSIETLASYLLGTPIDKADDEDVVTVVDIWKGTQRQITLGGTSYRLQEVSESDRL